MMALSFKKLTQMAMYGAEQGSWCERVPRTAAGEPQPIGDDIIASALARAELYKHTNARLTLVADTDADVRNFIDLQTAIEEIERAAHGVEGILRDNTAPAPAPKLTSSPAEHLTLQDGRTSAPTVRSTIRRRRPSE